MKQTIKLVGLDLDGTLLTTDHRITPRTRNAIARANAAGCLVIPATGRPLKGVPQEFLEIPGVDWAVTANGSTITDLSGKNSPMKFWIPTEDWFMVWDLTKDLNRVMDAFIDGAGCSTAALLERAEEWAPPGLADYIRKSRHAVSDVQEFVRGFEQIEKANLFFQDQKERMEAKRRIEATGRFEVTSSAPNNLELNAAGVSKGQALLVLAQKLGFEKSQVMACGDSGNDAVMLQKVGLGVAMGNADKEIRQLADYVTASNDEDGVAKAIEKFVLGEEIE